MKVNPSHWDFLSASPITRKTSFLSQSICALALISSANGLDCIGSSAKNTELGTFGVGMESTESSVVKPIVPSMDRNTAATIKPTPNLLFICRLITYNCKNANAKMT
ncbi:hypothetical protein OA314_00535 [bacterium]|nr:hypothetical protein [bacterium]